MPCSQYRSHNIVQIAGYKLGLDPEKLSGEIPLARKKPKARPPSVDPLGPTPERFRHDIVELLDRFTDDAGAISRPYRSVDTLATLERRGTITENMRHAGEYFRHKFAAAHLDPLHAASLEWSPRSAGDSSPSSKIESARDSVWRAIQYVGGISSPAGSCLWNVVGWERTLKDWALERGWMGKPIMQETASGILVAALGMLEARR